MTKRKQAYVGVEPESEIRKRYLSLVKGWAQEQKEGPSYWLSSDAKRDVHYQNFKNKKRREKHNDI